MIMISTSSDFLLPISFPFSFDGYRISIHGSCRRQVIADDARHYLFIFTVASLEADRRHRSNDDRLSISRIRCTIGRKLPLQHNWENKTALRVSSYALKLLFSGQRRITMFLGLAMSVRGLCLHAFIAITPADHRAFLISAIRGGVAIAMSGEQSRLALLL